MAAQHTDVRKYFTDIFQIDPQILEDYGAFNISLINDIFIRHSESVANASGITIDNKIIPLSELGWHQAKTVATSFKVKSNQL